MFYIFIFFSILLMNENIKTQILWNYTRLTTTIDLWINKRQNNNELIIKNIISINKKSNIKKKNYVYCDYKLAINSKDQNEKFIIKYKFKNNNFRIILNNTQLKLFNFRFVNVTEPNYLSVLNSSNYELTDIINEYAGPNRTFYQEQIDFNIEDIYLDSEFKVNYKYNIINNMADEIEINNIKELLMLF